MIQSLNPGEVNFEFISKPTEDFFNCTQRNSCISGGFGCGKTYVACMKILLLLTSFRFYRVAICRLEYKTLLQTTFKTFMKLCPQDFIASFDQQKGFMKFKNGSEILWMHLDSADEQTVKGLEINSCYIDQPEEIPEQVYTLMDARIGRWDMAQPDPSHIDPGTFKQQSNGRYIIPAYMLLTPNPDSESHWIWRLYHPDSVERRKEFAYFEAPSTDNKYLSKETLDAMMSHDESWVKRFVYGQWGISGASIHKVLPQSVLPYSEEFVHKIVREGNCYRILDHGESAPTCCTWWSAWKDNHICYREYYKPNDIISNHRKNIVRLSGDETYVGNYADPSIMDMGSQKKGGFWSIELEYSDASLLDEKGVPVPPLYWTAADNNELATRNRINELLAIDLQHRHPLSNIVGAPHIYFITASNDYPNGITQLKQIQAARRKKLAEIDGRAIYSDERESSDEDHFYDTVRYYIAMHARMPTAQRRTYAENSFMGARNRAKALKFIKQGYDKFGNRKSMA